MSSAVANPGPEQRDNPAEGPFLLLQKTVRDNSQILINLRSTRKIIARLKAYDRHMNMVLENAREMWVEQPKSSQKSKPINKQRFIQKLFLRGDSIISVTRNPK